MPKLIKNGIVSDDQWILIAAGESYNNDDDILLNVADWNDDAANRSGKTGIWLDSDQAPSLIPVAVNDLPVIAINFPAFADGRGYSYAHVLRQEMGYTGELRAVGDVLRDQLFFMQRCGFDAYSLRADRDAEQAIASFNDFQNSYQAAVDDSTPLFQKRWG